MTLSSPQRRYRSNLWCPASNRPSEGPPRTAGKPRTHIQRSMGQRRFCTLAYTRSGCPDLVETALCTSQWFRNYSMRARPKPPAISQPQCAVKVEENQLSGCTPCCAQVGAAKVRSQAVIASALDIIDSFLMSRELGDRQHRRRRRACASAPRGPPASRRWAAPLSV